MDDSSRKIRLFTMGKAFYHKPVIHIFWAMVLSLLAYSNTFHVPFQFDDVAAIIGNYNLKDLSNFWPPEGSRWFGFLTFALNYHFGGLNTTGYHIVNLIIHICNAILVYRLVVLTFKTPYFLPPFNSPLTKGGSRGVALFSALLFVSHPIQTQAVTYISQRFASLATLFYLLSLVMYIKFRSQQSAISRLGRLAEESGQQKLHATRYTLYAVSLISAVLAMKTKEISFTLPFIIVLYEFSFLGKLPRVHPASQKGAGQNLKSFFSLMPFLLTLLIIPLGMISIDKPIGDVIGELREAAQETEKIPRWSYLFTQFRVIVTYIRLIFLPVNQNLDYDYPIYHSFFNPQVFLSFLFLLLIFALGIYLFYRSRFTVSALADPPGAGHDLRFTVHSSRLIAFGIFWFFITLSVESSIIPIRDVIVEHRLYLPSVGVFIALSAVLFIAVERLKQRWRRIEGVGIVAAAVVIIALTGATYARNSVWKDWISLWADVASKSLKKARAYNTLGVAYQSKGLTNMAIEQYLIAIKLKPEAPNPYNNLGNVYYGMGQIDRAIEQYLIAIRLAPDFAEAYINLGIVYAGIGQIDKAIEQYRIAIKLKPDDPRPYYNLGLVYRSEGFIDRAIEHYRIAIKLKPDDPRPYYNLGNAYQSKGLTNMAIEHYMHAIRLAPDFAEAYINLGIVYAGIGQIDRAIEQYRIAIKLKPDDPRPYYNLGNAYESKGFTDKAIEEYRIVMRLSPDSAEPHFNLGRIYFEKGEMDKARREFEIALKINPRYNEARKFLERISFSQRGKNKKGS